MSLKHRKTEDVIANLQCFTSHHKKDLSLVTQEYSLLDVGNFFEK